MSDLAYATAIAKYQMEVMKYKAEVEIAMAQAVVLGWSIAKRGTMEDKALFTVYKAVNGFYAKMARGGIVVGTTLSDVCTAANAAVTDEAVRADEDGDVAEEVDDLSEWEEVEEDTVKIKRLNPFKVFRP